MRSAIIFGFLLLLGAGVFAQDESTVQPTEEPTAAPTTANPGLPYGSFCNGIIATCNRHRETVACLQRRAAPTTTTEAGQPTTESPIMAILRKSRQAAEPQDICETGFGVDLGRCQCIRNCKQGVYVDDGEFDPERDICVGLVGSTCSLLVPGCTKNGHCNFVSSKCVCDAGFQETEDRRCAPAA